MTPMHQAVSTNLGDRTAAWLYDRLTDACVRPPGMGHLEDPKLTSDLVVARDFDLGMTGPPLSISMDFIAGGHGRDRRRIRLRAGAVRVRLVGADRAGWRLAGDALAAARERRSGAIATPRKCAPRSAMPTTPTAWRWIRTGEQGTAPLRPGGLDDRPLRRAPHPSARSAVRSDTTAREADAVERRCWSSSPTSWCSGRWRAPPRTAGSRSAQVVAFVQSAVGASMIAFGGLSWALDGAAAPVAAVLRLEPAMRTGRRAAVGRSHGRGNAGARDPFPRSQFRLSGRSRSCSTTSTRRSRRDRRSPSSARTARARRRSPSSCAVCTIRSAGAIEIDGVDVRALDLASWRSRVTAVFQDFIRLELPLRDNVAPGGAPDDGDRARRSRPQARRTSRRSTPCSPAATRAAPISRAANGSASRSRVRCAPCTLGAGVVLLDEPTAQLDVRGEAEIFDRLLAATRHCTTILISHRFSTVRHADRICVLEHGRVVELGTHDELMALDGRYRTMFDLQAQRFTETGEEEGTTYDVLT